MSPISAVKVGLKVKKRREVHDRRPVSESLGCHVKGVAPTHPDHDSSFDYAAGIFKRFGRMTPYRDKIIYEELKEFTNQKLDHWQRKYGLTQMESIQDVKEWIANLNHGEQRKKQMYQAAEEDYNVRNKRDTKVNTFIKDEFYQDEYKYPRLINSRADIYKCRVGPGFSGIEGEVFKKMPQFIKKIPHDQRADYITQYLFKPGYYYFSTDYEAYETHFVRLMMISVEFQLYKRLAPNNAEGRQFIKDLEVLLETNHCSNKLLDAWIRATRMSGENCTSLGNGFSNLIFTKFACHKSGASCKAVVEGDDGLVRTNKKIDPQIFKKLGLIVKFKDEPILSESSFCGLISDEMSRQDVSNPYKILAKFGWSNRNYVGSSADTRRYLAVAKAYSYTYMYPHLPVVRPFCDYILRTVEKPKMYKILKYINKLDMYTRQSYLEALDAHANNKVPDFNPDIATRNLVDKLFEISVSTQYKCEDYLRSLSEYQVVDLPLEFSDSYMTNYDQYVSPLTTFNQVNVNCEAIRQIEALIVQRSVT